jgi:hypothetical protein
MERAFLPQVYCKVVACGLLMSSAVFAQSLGDVARENREKKAGEEASATAPQPRLITNKDLPKDAEGSSQPIRDEKRADAIHDQVDQRQPARSTEQRLAEQRAAQRWKRLIQAQKNRIAPLQVRADELNASIHSAYGSVQTEGPYNRYQGRLMERLAQVQEQLATQKLKLEQMQEEARQAGLHSAVYDP